MYLCNDGHEEVCHEGRNCPCCELIQERDKSIKDLEEANAEISHLEEKVSDLESERE